MRPDQAVLTLFKFEIFKEVYIFPTTVTEIATFTIFPALAVGCTGKGRFGVSSRLHWEGSIRR